MTFEQLAVRYHACEKIDTSVFQRRARLLQSIWREHQSLPIGKHAGRNGVRPLGSKLAMPEAEVGLTNFLSDRIRAVVREEVLNPLKSKGKVYGRPRIFDNLLSSQPLCFNLFAELQCDLPLATLVFRNLTHGRIEKVVGIDFEHSPGRSDPVYSDDRSAFDLFVTFITPSGKSGFVGIEVKYHENLLNDPAAHRDRYDEIATIMSCFSEGKLPVLRKKPLQQIWRDHLLAGILKTEGGYDDGFSLFVYPAQNLHCHAAVDAYRACLTCARSFMAITLEAVVAEVKRQTSDDWIHRLYDRYLNFSKIDLLLR